jgi:hypothetical protein
MLTARPSTHPLLGDNSAANVFLVNQSVKGENFDCKIRGLVDGKAAIEVTDYLDRGSCSSDE